MERHQLSQKDTCQATQVCFATQEQGMVTQEWDAGSGVGKLVGGKERF